MTPSHLRHLHVAGLVLHSSHISEKQNQESSVQEACEHSPTNQPFMGNSLLAGRSVSNLVHLQLVQNVLACVMAQKSRFDHMTPVLSEVPLASHDVTDESSKIASITYKMLQFKQLILPSWTQSMVCTYMVVVHQVSIRQSITIHYCVAKLCLGSSGIAMPIECLRWVHTYMLWHFIKVEE